MDQYLVLICSSRTVPKSEHVLKLGPSANRGKGAVFGGPSPWHLWRAGRRECGKGGKRKTGNARKNGKKKHKKPGNAKQLQSIASVFA